MRRYYNTKKATAKQAGIPFELELRDIYWLLYCARINVEQVGKRRGEYQLARFGDTGPYALGNCRFITSEENLREKDHTWSPESRAHRIQALKGAWTPQRRAALGERNKLR